MRRVVRAIFGLLAVTSLLVGVTAAVIWPIAGQLSLRNRLLYTHQFRSDRPIDVDFALWRDGILIEASDRDAVLAGSGARGFEGAVRGRVFDSPWYFGGYPTTLGVCWVYDRTSTDPMAFNATLLVRFWLIILLSSPLPMAFGIAAFRNRRRKVAGLCAACGYDLRGSPKDGACPECGAKR